jgi:4-aminobutyrate aminotransferase/(S)-3-amino-2-methylpropionate transaminase
MGTDVAQSRSRVTDIPGPRSRAAAVRRGQAVPAGLGAVLPAFIAAAEGSVLKDLDDNRILDLGSGIAVSVLGHRPPAVVGAVREQLDAFLHTCFTVSPYEQYVEVCERLNRLAPGDRPHRTVLSNSGSEAVENAVKIARATTGRQGIVAFEGGYHGRTYMAMALTSRAVPYKSGFAPFPAEVYRAPFPDAAAGTSDDDLDRGFRAFVDAVQTSVGATNVAAVVIEPVLGEAGFIVPPAGFLARVRDWCTLHGILLIADEVQTGFGRTGDWFACEHDGVVPDLLVTGKSIASGLPLAAVTGDAALMDAAPRGGLGGTYAGNPLSCAAAMATLDELERIDAPALARRLGSRMRARLDPLVQDYGMVGRIRGRGAMLAVEFVLGADDATPHPAMAAAVAQYCHREGVLVMVTGAHRSCIRLLPALTMPHALIDDALGVLGDAVREAA